ncbi:complement decay-accelerating factor isoform X2 [Takifugu rubripes]|uniref:Complement decay-accelerating factor n=1 Tax=Takifugu rubripes TaxID=31033 RepID=A0A3B5KAC2_TAKRU|nr:complement decay-accelerating factor isoform X2 [Takifugu rubripes]|eukprot:XP_011611951.1 PREDICTED: complement decay-accelerating factor isoform X1 [Takifugu rubripes]
MERFVKVCTTRGVKILVFLHLIFVNAAAQCQKPQATEIIVLSEAALLLNSFPEGSEVILECGRGYEKESGSGATVCTNREWRKPNLTCKEMDCGLPKSEPNMKFNTSQGTRFRALVRVFCDKGYYLIGSSFRQCFPRGWVGRAKCKIVTCDQPGNVTNGMNLWNSKDRPKYGDTIEYLCNGGYTLVGKEKIVCTETGKYDSHPPECQGVTKENGITTVMMMSTSPTTDIKTSYFTVTVASTESPAATAHRDKTITTSAAATVSHSEQGSRHMMKAAAEGTTGSVSSTTLLEDLNQGTVDTNKDTGHIAVVLGMLCIVLVGFTIGLCVRKFLLRRKGSYDTREDVKPEFLQFQNL